MFGSGGRLSGGIWGGGQTPRQMVEQARQRNQRTYADEDPDAHTAGVRPMRINWTQQNGEWVSDGTDPKRWEVFCEACGDPDGPIDWLLPVNAKMRGPYRSHRKAEDVARRHYAATESVSQ
jgi:hypothetical protein